MTRARMLAVEEAGLSPNKPHTRETLEAALKAVKAGAPVEETVAEAPVVVEPVVVEEPKVEEPVVPEAKVEEHMEPVADLPAMEEPAKVEELAPVVEETHVVAEEHVPEEVPAVDEVPAAEHSGKKNKKKHSS